MTNAKERMMKLLPENLKNFISKHEQDVDGDYVIKIQRTPTNEIKSWIEELDERFGLVRDRDRDYATLNCELPMCQISFFSYDEFVEDIHLLQILFRGDEREKPPIAILNTTILTSDGDFKLSTISLDEAKEIVKYKEIVSAVGHESTAQILTELLGVNVPINKINFKQEKGQTALCFKLKGRPEEGKVLTVEDIESIGYEFKKLEMM